MYSLRPAVKESTRRKGTAKKQRDKLSWNPVKN